MNGGKVDQQNLTLRCRKKYLGTKSKLQIASWMAAYKNIKLNEGLIDFSRGKMFQSIAQFESISIIIFQFEKIYHII